jgi:hypothetical protein
MLTVQAVTTATAMAREIARTRVTATATAMAMVTAMARLATLKLVWFPPMQRQKHSWMLECLSTRMGCRGLDWTM